jgi:histidine phosphotransferase ChpT
MLVVASQAIPRGGVLAVESTGADAATTFKITAKGLNARIAQAVPDLLAGSPASGTVDAHAIQPFYTGLLARHCGLAVSIEAEGDAIVVAAR